MKSFDKWMLLAVGFLVCLFTSPFVLPIGYTYDEVCPKCNGEGTVVCWECHGSGKCWVCGGDGIIDYMPPGSQWCAACQGTGICPECGGKGWHTCEECGGDGILNHWMYSSIGVTVVSSIITVPCFLGLFFLNMMSCAFYADINQWVYDVRDMNFWFNPMFMTWLFAKDRERWAKWSIPLSLIFGIFLGILLFAFLSMKQITEESLVTSSLSSSVVIVLFSFVFYNLYTKWLEVPKKTANSE